MSYWKCLRHRAHSVRHWYVSHVRRERATPFAIVTRRLWSPTPTARMLWSRPPKYPSTFPPLPLGEGWGKGLSDARGEGMKRALLVPVYVALYQGEEPHIDTRSDYKEDSYALPI